MSDSQQKPKNPGGETSAEFDRDVNIRAAVWSGASLAGIALVSFVIAWFVYRGFATYEERQNPEPLPMPEASEPLMPPGPRLQATPEQDLADMRAEEDALLEHYSLVEAGGEYARIPIERAMELELERGLGQEAAEPQGAAPPAAADTTEGSDGQQ